MKKERLGFSIVAILAVLFSLAAAKVDLGAPVTLDIKGMEILDVLKIISLRSGLSIAASPQVKGQVTFFLKDISVWDAFEILIAANDLAYEKRSNMITVMTNKEYQDRYGKPFYDLRIFKKYTILNSKVESMGPTVEALKSNIGRVVIDANSNSIVVLDTPEVIYEIDKVVQEIDVPLETKVIQLNYSRIEDVKDNISDLINKDIGSIKFDERSNRVVVTDIPSNVRLISDVLRAFDKRPKAVQIESKIIQISLSDEYRYGVDWKFVFGKDLGVAYSGNFSLPAVGSAGVGEIAIGKAALNASASLDGANQYRGFLKMFDTFGKSEILSSPRITVLSGQEAYVLVGDKEPVISVTMTSSGAGENIYTESVEYVDTGVRLSVTPRIAEDGYITMNIKPEVSSAEYVTTDRGSKYPKKTTSEAETSVILKDGDTIVLAGLMKETDEKGVEKVPGLSNIPILGKLFSEEHKKKVKTELVILLTPNIIGDRVDMPFESTDSYDKEQTIPGYRAGAYTVDSQSVLGQDGERESYTGYYLKVTNIIYDYLSKNYLDLGLNKEVNVVFILSNSGNLVGEPAVIGDVDSTVKDLAIQVIKKNTPFPPFPLDIGKEKEAFNVLLTF